MAAFACTLCEKRYDYADDLQQHMQLRHPQCVVWGFYRVLMVVLVLFEAVRMAVDFCWSLLGFSWFVVVVIVVLMLFEALRFEC